MKEMKAPTRHRPIINIINVNKLHIKYWIVSSVSWYMGRGASPISASWELFWAAKRPFSRPKAAYWRSVETILGREAALFSKPFYSSFSIYQNFTNDINLPLDLDVLLEYFYITFSVKNEYYKTILHGSTRIILHVIMRLVLETDIFVYYI